MPSNERLADAGGGADPSPSRPCSACGFQSPSGMRFCGGCGAPLGPVLRPEFRTKADRRQLTVVFCDLVGSTALSERLDPEELREIVWEYQEASSEVVARYQGHVAQYLGDGLLIYFGHPRAHEDDPWRAVHAALDIVAAVAELGRRTEAERGFRLAVRVGIHTGEVVTSEIGDRNEQLALGAVPNVAARLQALAEPDAVVVSAATVELTRGFFELRKLGEHDLKGLSRPLEVFAVVGESGVASRFELAVNRGLLPFVGRDPELAELVGLFDEAEAGQGRIALIRGEAGIGKSRLVHQLREALVAGGRDQVWLIGRCSDYHRQSAFHSLADLLAFRFRLRSRGAGLGPAERLRRLERELEVLGEERGAVLPLFATLLGLPVEGAEPSLSLPPEWRKKRIFDAVLSLLEGLGSRQPAVMVFEDIQWIDPSTRELLDLVIEEPPGRTLTLLTCRPSFEDPWGRSPHLRRLDLGSLDRRAVEALVDSVAGGRALPPDLRRGVIERTDGIPLFVEELTAAVLDADPAEEGGVTTRGGPTQSSGVPATLQDFLAARLDRLGSTREVAQLGSVIGRSFNDRLLRAIAQHDVEDLQRELDRLVESRVCFRQGHPPEVTYVFRHALVREAAYASLLRSRRRELHSRIGRTLIAEFPDLAEAEPEVVARHFTEAGLAEEAATHWLQASRRALDRAATSEALDHVETGLGLLADLTESRPRLRLEFELQMVRATVYMHRESYASEEAERSFLRAQNLGSRLGDSGPQYGLPIFYLVRAYMVRADFPKAQQLAEEFLDRSDPAIHPTAWTGALRTLALVRFSRGDLRGAARDLNEILALCRRSQEERLTYPNGEDVETVTLIWSSFARWHLGEPSRAREEAALAVRRARRLEHPYTLAYALVSESWVHHFCSEPEAVLASSLESVAISEERGFFWKLLARILVGWARIHGVGASAEDADREIEAMRRGIESYQASGARLTQTYLLGVIAEACITRKQYGAARESLEQALAVGRETGESFWLPELRRLQGELEVARTSSAGTIDAETSRRAAAAFHEAIELARGQGSRSLELRAAVSLARHADDADARAEARELLAELCRTYPEQGSSANLDAARVLLSLP